MEREELISKLQENTEYQQFKAGERNNFSYVTTIAMYKVQVSDDDVTVRFRRLSRLTEQERTEVKDWISLLTEIALAE